MTRLERAEVDRILNELTPPFADWLKEVTPLWTWHWRHLEYVRKYLDKITSGEIDRLMVFLPPRHGKSEMVTVRYPVWRMERDREMRVIIGAYNQTLANKFSRKGRRIAESRFALSTDRTAVDDWETVESGGLRAVGVGAGITGHGAQLIVIDDPVKSREEAASEAYRQRVWEWYRDDLYTRLEPGGAIILIMTRWHEDDLAGRILASEDAPNWTVVNLPAEAEEDDPLGREMGEALCPERYPLPILRRIRTVLGSYSYAALFQQKPQPAEGNLAQRQWFKIVGAVPVDVNARVRAWDFAASEKKVGKSDPDYTVGTLMSTVDGITYIEHVIRDRLGPGAVESLVRQTAEADGKGVWVHLEQEPGSSGKLFVDSLIKELAGWKAKGNRPTGDKVSRGMPLMAQAEAGNVRLVKGEWNRAWLDEICGVPTAAHDDQWDSAAAGYEFLTTLIPQPAQSMESLYGPLAEAVPPTQREVMASTHADTELHRRWAQKHFCQQCYDEWQTRNGG